MLDLWLYGERVEALVGIGLPDNQFGALVSLAYDVGLANFERSAVLRHHIAGDQTAARMAFTLREKAGRRFAGSLPRRQAEAKLYGGGK